jgi:hypothetical protein
VLEVSPATPRYLPTVHFVQLTTSVPATSDLHDPAGQSVHADIPVDAPYLPVGQSEQLASAIAPVQARYLPVTHIVQSEDIYFPPVAFPHEPCGQLVHAERPDVLPYLPIWQSEQLELLATLNEPASQTVQLPILASPE